MLLHRIRQRLRTAPQRFQRAPLRVHGAVGVTFAQRAFRVAHPFIFHAPILDGKGALIGWIQKAGGNRTNILDRKWRVVARFTGQVLPLRP